MSKDLANAKRIMLDKSGAAPPETVDPRTIITENSIDILLTRKCLIQISNAVSRKLNRGLTQIEFNELVPFIQNLPARNYLNIPLGKAQEIICDQFISRGKVVLTEEQAHLREFFEAPSDMHEYQKKELNNLTNDENPLKLSAHPDRRGNAIIDEDRIHNTHIMANRSTYNNIAPDATQQQQSQAIVDSNYEVARVVRSFQDYLNPETIGEILMRNRNSWVTYESVVLPHQTVPLDSRYRIPNHLPGYEYKWYVHSAGVPGSNGDIRLLDTLKEIIQMEVYPFWIPVGDINEGYYGKIRMLVNEFSPQSTPFYQFLEDGSTYSNAYHFQFSITQRESGRFYLTPDNPVYRFRKPFARPETITISFTDPFQQVLLEPDNMLAVVSNTNPAVFTTLPNDVATGDLVYVQNFNSINPTLNNAVNRKSGYIATRLSSTTFSIPVDLSTLPGPVSNVFVYFGSKRLIIPIEFTSLEQ